MPEIKLNIPRRSLALGTVALFAALVTPSAAIARRGGRARFSGVGLPGRGAYGPNTLTADQLESCVRTEIEINRSADDIDRREALLSARQADLDRLGREIDAQAISLNRYSQASVNAYNNQVNRHRQLVAEFNAQLPSFNSSVDQHNQRVENFNNMCARKQYYAADMAIVRQRLGVQ